MKKIINKIMCFLAIFILCVPLLCFCVFAENIKIDLAYYGIDTFNYNTDGLKFNSDDINSSGGLLFSAKNFIATKISKDDLRIKYQNYVNGRYYNIPPYDYIEYSDGTYSIQAVGDKYIQFLNGLDYLHSSTSLNNSVINYNSEQNYYYFVFYYSYSTPDNYYDSNGSSSRFEEVTHIDTSRCVTYISTTPFSFKSSPNGYYLDGSQKYVAITGNSVSSGLYNGDPFTTCHSFNNYSSEESILFDKNMIYQFNNDSVVNYNFLGAYTNSDIDVSMFDNTDNLHKGITDLKPKTFSEKVSVKLTPKFGFDMDRIYDKNTGQKDYFKFEITNKSNTNIQWCAYIVDSSYEDDLTGLGDTDTRYLVPSYEYCKWLYIKDEVYYSSSVKKEEKYLGLKTETTLSANKKTGAFYFHLLKPGETFSDYIYWENVNIQPLKSYDIRFNALPIDDLIYPSDMFNSRYFFDTLGSILGSDFEKEEHFDDYVINDELYSEVYRCSFSTLEMPEFTLNVKGGGSVANAGFEDAQTLKNNFETSTDLSDGRIHTNSNYIENPLLLNGADVNVNLDNVTIDNVKSYISQCSDFFSILKSVLISFPSWIWVLICFGLTALIVIGILRYIRG